MREFAICDLQIQLVGGGLIFDTVSDGRFKLSDSNVILDGAVETLAQRGGELKKR